MTVAYPKPWLMDISVEIDAPREAVWFVLTDDKLFRYWSVYADPDSSVTGDWSEGGEIVAITPGGFGIVSEIAANQPLERLHFKHIAMVVEGKRHTDVMESWGRARECYDLAEKNGKTELRLQADIAAAVRDAYKKEMPEALERIKEAAEAVVKSHQELAERTKGLPARGEGEAWTLAHDTEINAPRETVWHVLTDDKLFPSWHPFGGEGARFVASWKEYGVAYLVNAEGKKRLYSVAASKPRECLHLKLTGAEVSDKFEYDVADEWGEGREHYDLADDNGKTKLCLEVNIADKQRQHLITEWALAMQKVKDLAEAMAKVQPAA